MTVGEQAIVVNGLRKAFKDFVLEIDRFSLDRGYVLGLVGPNGAGKSTLIKSLLHLIHPDQGRVQVLGLDQPTHETEIKRRVGYVSEQPTFYPQMTVGWMNGLVSRYYPTWNARLNTQLLQKFGLNSDKRVKDLSRGMKVKLALVLALSHEPELLILDEPTSGLDPVFRRELLEEIMTVIQDEQRSVLFSSHITQDVELVADYVAMIQGGRIVEHEEKEALLQRWKRVTGYLDGKRVALHDHFYQVQVDGNTFSGVTNQYSSAWQSELQRLGCGRLQVANMSVDDILLVRSGRSDSAVYQGVR